MCLAQTQLVISGSGIRLFLQWGFGDDSETFVGFVGVNVVTTMHVKAIVGTFFNNTGRDYFTFSVVTLWITVVFLCFASFIYFKGYVTGEEFPLTATATSSPVGYKSELIVERIVYLDFRTSVETIHADKTGVTERTRIWFAV
jgi:hypothetical protein